MSKAKKILVCVVLLSFLFVSTADAILWFLAGAIRAGAIAVSVFISTPIGQAIVRSVVNHALVGGVAYLYLNRGDSVPPSEKYIRVTLTDTQSVVQAAKEQGKITYLTSPAGGWATGSATYGIPSDCSLNCGAPGYLYNTCDTFRRSVPLGSTGCVLVGGTWNGEYAKEVQYSFCTSGVVTYSNKLLVACTTAQKNTWVSSGSPQTDIVNTILDNSSLKAEVQSGIGRDMQRGGTLVEAPVAGEPVIDVGVDGTTKEWPSGYSEEDVEAWLSNTPSIGSVAPSAVEIGVAVGSAVNPNLVAIKTSVDGVKTSVDGVKTSVDGVNTKLGSSQGSLTSPSYDTVYTDPTENNIGNRITSFVSSNPIIGAISGSHLSLSGAVCTTTVGSAFEKPLILDFCWMETYLTMFGNVMVVFAGLTAAFIIFRRGD